MNTASANTGASGQGRKRILVTIVLFLFFFVAGFFISNAVNPVRTQRQILRIAEWWHGHWPLSQGRFVFYRLYGKVYDLGIMKPVQITLPTGIRMELDGRDFVTQTLLMTEIWEPEVTQWVTSSLKPGDVFVDVGAHVGYYTLLAGKLVGESGKVVAVEPNPATVTRLERDIALNPFQNIVVRKVACTDRETTLRFFQAPIDNTGTSSINKSNAHEGNEISVPGVPLDKIIQDLGINRVDLVKIDVEGAEMMVLGGMTNIIASYHPKVSIELKDDLLKNMGSSLEAAKALFLQNGYTLQSFDGIDDFLWVPRPQTAAK
jgi:FkbM family methyltransferase